MKISGKALLVKTDAQLQQSAERVLFLGPWCRESHHTTAGKSILPHHLDDINRVDKWENKIDEIYDYYLSELSLRLNEIHNTNWSDRAWRVLIGPWLQVFLDVVIDRFETIQQVTQSSEELYISVTRFENQCFAYLRTVDFFVAAANSDEFNEYIFSEILLRLPEGRVLISNIVGRNSQTTPSLQRHPSLPQKALRIASRWVARFPRRVTFVDSYFNRADQVFLEILLGQLPFIPPPDEVAPQECSDNLIRQELAVKPFSSETLHRIICELIQEMLPISYVENFQKNLSEAQRCYPKSSRLIVTAHFYSYNELFRFWAASQVDNGARLAAIQHGGGYGVGLRWSPLAHELSVADFYYTSGWRSNNHCSTLPMPIPKLVNAQNRFSVSSTGGILWVWKALRPYSFRLAEGSVNNDSAEYLDEQIRFGNRLDKNIQSQTIIRLYGLDSAWNEVELARAKLPQMKLDLGRIAFEFAARDKKLWVITYNSTTLLEALVANIPFVAYWNPKHCVNRLARDASPLIEEFRNCGVFHDTPESAADAANEYFPRAQQWWERKNIQRIRSEFCEKFALTRSDWLSAWRHELERVSSL